MPLSAVEPILNTLVNTGIFGCVTYHGLETDDTVKGSQFSSDLSFVNLTLNGSTGKEVLPLVVKLASTNTEGKGYRNFDAMFHNEVTMYKEILPDLVVGTNFHPRMFYGLATNGSNPEKDILILENLKYKNFIPAKEKIFLDIDHISIAIKKIAKFHSFSFIHKHEEKESFLQMTKKLKSIDPSPEDSHESEVITAACIERGIKPLLKDNISIDLLTDCLTLLKCPMKARNFLATPEEPFAVICHGDLCNNNLLYKFDENGKPIDCVFIDFQYSMYGSPIVDLFFFLYLNTSSELREKHWDMILMLYWDTLRECVPDRIFLPTFEDFLKHFAERVIYGYTITSFFLPMMMEKNPINENEKQPTTIEEKITFLTSLGGKEAEQALSEIVLHLLNKGYIHAFLELCKQKKFEC